jgi:hypothetical protein
VFFKASLIKRLFLINSNFSNSENIDHSLTSHYLLEKKMIKVGNIKDESRNESRSSINAINAATENKQTEKNKRDEASVTNDLIRNSPILNEENA